MTTPPPTDYYGKILKQFDWTLRKAPNRIIHPTPFTEKLIHHALMYSTGIPTFKVKWETTKMNIQEKDCRRCEKYDAEDKSCRSVGGIKEPQITCTAFTPISGRDCRNCERFNGKDEGCTPGLQAHDFKLACSNFDPILGSTSSPTVLVYTDREGDKIRVTKGDKTLCLVNILSKRPCGDEFRKMNIAFTTKGYDFDDDIPFTQDNLNLLSDLAFHWLLEEDFLIKAEEEKVEYELGQWFSHGETSAKYVIVKTDIDAYMLICLNRHPSVCTGTKKETIKEVSEAIHKFWYDLTPIDPPFEV